MSFEQRPQKSLKEIQSENDILIAERIRLKKEKELEEREEGLLKENMRVFNEHKRDGEEVMQFPDGSFAVFNIKSGDYIESENIKWDEEAGFFESDYYLGGGNSIDDIEDVKYLMSTADIFDGEERNNDFAEYKKNKNK